MGEYTEAAANKAALRLVNNSDLGPAPDAGLRHYGSEAMRQVSLAHAEQANIRTAATDAGVTTDVWLTKRKELGRSPTSRDFSQ
jgi:hypothetical protein